ncbi:MULTISPECIES: glycosyltransferase family 4 protein [Microbacterium]|uniref:glycosyltransferase family 4 protein n=1 Tax=Microbacterium TaxID=33882 RepID=UPI0011EB7073|nr:MULTISPECIES: glycosyltransferase family 4 protein [Microbacterium]
MSALAGLKRAVTGAIPDPVAERVLPWRRAAFRSAGVTTVAPAERRLFIAPVNSAGQGYAWARAAERLPGVSAANFMYRGADDVFAYPADHSVPTAYFVANRRWQAAQRRAVARGFTHAVVESGRQVLGGGSTPEEDIAWLRDRGLRVALLWHGSDIRRPDQHARREPDSPFRDGSYPEQPRLQAITEANHRLMRTLGLPVFVSTPDLLTDVPEATWLPVVVDADPWSAAAPSVPLRRDRPVVVHAPSRAGLKGTATIAPTLRRLHGEGVIEYREVTGVSAARMPEVYGEADIVLDQFSLGIYGVAACEALASGRVVVSHVSDEVRERVRTRTGRELPVLESRAADLDRVLRGILADRDRAATFAAAGPGFVRAVHSGQRAADALSGFLGEREG